MAEEEEAPPSPPPPQTADSTSTVIPFSLTSPIRSLQEFGCLAKTRYSIYEDAFFTTLKDELTIVKEHPTEAIGVALASTFLLLRGPRRFLFRHTVGRFQSEEARFVKAEKSVQGLNISVDVMKNESKKLLQRAALAEKDMKRGHTELRDTGSQIQHLAKSVYKAQSQATGARKYVVELRITLISNLIDIHVLVLDLMDALRQIPGRDALKLRAEASCFDDITPKEAQESAGQTDTEDI
ncbi:hypothetical protein ACFE04_026620 [Oxalis oulophora]